MSDKSSETCLGTLKEILNDISHTTSLKVGYQILMNIKNTMSDRAATEKKFHILLTNFREEILPCVHSNWDELTAIEKETLFKMNNFYCGLHMLVNFAELCDKVVKTFHNNTYENETLGAESRPETAIFSKRDESGPIRLVRTACKCIARGADEKSGCYIDFKTFLNDKYSKLLFSEKGQQFSIETLTENVKKLIRSALAIDQPTNREYSIYF